MKGGCLYADGISTSSRRTSQVTAFISEQTYKIPQGPPATPYLEWIRLSDKRRYDTLSPPPPRDATTALLDIYVYVPARRCQQSSPVATSLCRGSISSRVGPKLKWNSPPPMFRGPSLYSSLILLCFSSSRSNPARWSEVA